MRLYSEPHPNGRKVNVTGIDNHQLPSKHIVQCCAVSKDTSGEDVLCIFNEYANTTEMATSIHSTIQLRAYGLNVQDAPHLLRGGQRIVCVSGRIFPLTVHHGLCYLEQRLPTDEEMHLLPQEVMTAKSE